LRTFVAARNARHCNVRPKLHHTDTGYGHVVQHHQRTSSQQFYNLLCNKFATSQCQNPTSRHVKMLRCGKLSSVGGEFVVQQVVELLSARPLVVLHNMSVAGVRVVELGTNGTRDVVCNVTSCWKTALRQTFSSGICSHLTTITLCARAKGTTEENSILRRKSSTAGDHVVRQP